NGLTKNQYILLVEARRRSHHLESHNRERQMATEERVLCFERKLLEELGVFEGLSLEIEKYLPVVTSPSHLLYLNRSDAETDKRYKQLIPYVLVVCIGKILRYRRGRGIVGPEFIPFAEAVKDSSGYESWSRFCLEHLDALLSKAAASGVAVPERLKD